MRITWNWLRELVPVELGVTEVAELLVRAGIEVESIEPCRPTWDAVEVAEVVAVVPHPGADRLRLCRVRRAAGEVAVVCGAPNVAAGQRVALAVPGTVLSDGRRIERSTIRGQDSEGMLCSARELGLPEGNADGILVLEAEAAVGTRLVDHLRADDVVLELGLTPNRGDCLSVLGIAREVAAATGVALVPVAASGDGRHAAVPKRPLGVRVDAPDLCPRYCGRLVEGVRIGPSPAWLRTRLALVGLRPINNVVDATNYVMLERGQPTHAFDRARLVGRTLRIRRAGAALAFRTLDGGERALVPDDLVIADGRGAVALAGVMGGADSEIRDDTVDLFLESAFFTPETVRRTSRRLLLSTDSSYRFERGVDPASTAAALDRLTELVLAHAGGAAAPMVERRARSAGARRPIALTLARVNDLLGTALVLDDVERPLRALGGAVARKRGGVTVVPPPHRFDLEADVDLVEEVARLRGYDRIPESRPAIVADGAGVSPSYRLAAEVRAVVRAAGFTEMLTLAMIPADDNAVFPGLHGNQTPIALRNPLSLEGAELRRSLLPGLLRAVDANLRQGESCVAGFAIGRVYGRADGAVREAETLGLVALGTWPSIAVGDPARVVDFADLKGAVSAVLAALRVPHVRFTLPSSPPAFLHPGKAAVVLVDGSPIGVVGALHPDLRRRRGLDDHEPWIGELDLQNLLRYVPPRVEFQPLPRFPAVQRDLAVVVDCSFEAQQVLDVIREIEEPLVEEVRVFDQYTGAPIPDGKKSLAYRVAYRASDRTLTDAEVNGLQEAVLKRLVQRLGVEVRR